MKSYPKKFLSSLLPKKSTNKVTYCAQRIRLNVNDFGIPKCVIGLANKSKNAEQVV